jgi:lysophospholipase L1-like esterase
MFRQRGVCAASCAAAMWLSAMAAAAWAEEPVSATLRGDWQLEVQADVPDASRPGATRRATALVEVPRPVVVTVTAERCDGLAPYRADAPGWMRATRLTGVAAQECSTLYLLDRQSLVVREGAEPGSRTFVRGRDYEADLDWGMVGRLPGGIREGQAVYLSYRHATLRIDAIVAEPSGAIQLRRGEPRSAAPLPPALRPGERRLANVWLPGFVAKLDRDHIFEVLESEYPKPPLPAVCIAERVLPKTLAKLREGKPLRVLAWGDSVTDGGYIPNYPRDRWQEQFVARLQSRFPTARIELVTEAWGGRNTGSYLAEPPGSPHNYKEKVLGAKPDLIVSEFVNDAGLSPAQVEQHYGALWNDFRRIGAEWIILTPHYVRPDWMGLSRQRDVDNDPRPYVQGLRQFTARHPVALADASLRYGRLWRQGIPYSSLMLNSINHPDARGMKIFADSLIAVFP